MGSDRQALSSPLRAPTPTVSVFCLYVRFRRPVLRAFARWHEYAPEACYVKRRGSGADVPARSAKRSSYQANYNVPEIRNQPRAPSRPGASSFIGRIHRVCSALGALPPTRGRFETGHEPPGRCTRARAEIICHLGCRSVPPGCATHPLNTPSNGPLCASPAGRLDTRDRKLFLRGPERRSGRVMRRSR